LITENVKVLIAWSGKTSAEPKRKSKQAAPTNPNKKEDEVEAADEAEPRPKKEGVDLGKSSPKDISDRHVLPFPHQVKKLVEDE
jgi:hypothetical protein